MPCQHVKIPGGGYAIICGRGKRPIICSVCHRIGSKLCDWPVGNGKTCDRPLCDACAVSGGKEIDFCPSHQQERLKL